MLTCCGSGPSLLRAAAGPDVMAGSGSSLSSFIDSYQKTLFTLFALLAGTAVVIIGGSTVWASLTVCDADVEGIRNKYLRLVVLFSPLSLCHVLFDEPFSHSGQVFILFPLVSAYFSKTKDYVLYYLDLILLPRHANHPTVFHRRG